MKVCSFENSGKTTAGILEGNELVDAGVSDVSSLLMDPRKAKQDLEDAPRTPYKYERLRRPFTPTEVWGAGITYIRSRDAREIETEAKGIYERVYDAVRPEIFFKDSGYRTVGPGDSVCVRSDSNWTVPEPELTVVIDKAGEIRGYTVGNDVSARDIEGQNPLYIPQCKIYRNSCAIGPVVTTADEIPDPRTLKIEMRIYREGKTVFEGSIETSRLKRSVEELVSYLKKDNQLFGWTAFLTGTGIVPPDDFALKGGETVEIEIEKIGVLRNPVTKLS